MAITVVLGNGELGYDPVNNVAKIGNGSTQWDSLNPFNKTEIIDNLTSDSTSAALSAHQGKVLKNSIDSNTSAISENTDDINTNKLNIIALQNKTSDLNVNDITTMKSDINNRRFHAVINYQWICEIFVVRVIAGHHILALILFYPKPISGHVSEIVLD